MSEILDRMLQNPKKVQEPLVQCYDQEDEEEEAVETEDSAEVTTKEENIPTEVEEIIHTTISKNLCEIVLDRNNISNGNTVVTVEIAMEIYQLIAETTGVYSNEIFLHPFHVQPQIPNPKIMLFTGKKRDSPFTVLNLINSSIFMSIFKVIPEDLNHPPSLSGKLVTGFWNFDPGIRTVATVATAADQRLLRLMLDGTSDLKANFNPQWLMARGLVDRFGSLGPSVANGIAGTRFFSAVDHFKAYTYGIRNGMAVIGSMANQNARFMFVNTKPLFDEIFNQMTKKIELYNPNQNSLWRTGGFLTNSRSPKKFPSRCKTLFGYAFPGFKMWAKLTVDLQQPRNLREDPSCNILRNLYSLIPIWTPLCSKEKICKGAITHVFIKQKPSRVLSTVTQQKY